MLPDDWREDGIRPADRTRTAAAAATEASQSNPTPATGTTKKEV